LAVEIIEDVLWSCTGHGQAKERAEDPQAAILAPAETRIEQEEPAPDEEAQGGFDAKESEQLSEQEQEDLNDDIELICETLANIAGRLKTRAMLTQVQTFLDNLSPADNEDEDDTGDDDNASGGNEGSPGTEGAGGKHADPDHTSHAEYDTPPSTDSVEYPDDEWPEGLRQLSAEDWQDEAKKAGMDLQAFKRLVMREHRMQSRNP
jgi:hypothetical protein